MGPFLAMNIDLILPDDLPYHPRQAEFRNIVSLTESASAGTTALTLDSPLAFDHWAKVKRQRYGGSGKAAAVVSQFIV